MTIASNPQQSGIIVGSTLPSLPSCELEELRRTISSWLHMAEGDEEVVDIVLALYKSNELSGDPLWGIIIDASGGGKTELVRTLRGRPDIFFLSKLTERTLVSGYRDPDHPNQDMSLLPQLNGKALVIKDLSPLLSMRRESRNAIISDLRDAYDGFTDQGYGNVGKVSYQSRFTIIAASTMAVERFDAVDQELGERFIKVRVRSNENSAKVRRAIANVGRDDPMRSEIALAVSKFLETLPSAPQEFAISNEQCEALTVISDFTATARSCVPRDKQHNLRYVPRPEVGTRLGKELAKLLWALALVHGKPVPESEELRTVARVAEDCLPPNRLAILRVLRAGPATISSIAAVTGLPRTTVKQTLEDLEVLRLVSPAEQQAEAQSDSLWQLTSEWKQRLEHLFFLKQGETA
jgi:DNA-binding transcriptional ArsR family regulator